MWRTPPGRVRTTVAAEMERREVLHPHRRDQENPNRQRRLDPDRSGVTYRPCPRIECADCLGQVDQATEVFGIVELTQSRSVALSHARVLWVDLTADRLQRRDLFRTAP